MGAGADKMRLPTDWRRATLAGGASLIVLAGLGCGGQARAQQAGGTVQLDTVELERKAAQTATGPIDGYVATQSAAGSKTSTPLIRTPQAVAVVGAKQINDQQARTIDEAVRYSPGIHGQTFGSDPRNDWFTIRGFNEQTTGYYLDGLQLFSTSFATFKVEPWNLERIEIVRGPSAVLYGGGDPGGLINAVSKLPTFTTFGVVEGGVNSFGNVYGAADLGGVAGANKEWAWRFTSLGRIGGTQTNFTDDDRAFVAPSLTYRPNATTTFTLLGQFQKDFSNGQNFLPYVGTVTPAAFGRIPTRLFTSEPALDTFRRDQDMIGYRFETAITPDIVVRQNVRYEYLFVNYQTLYGNGYVTPPTADDAQLSRFNFVTRPTVNSVQADNQAEFHFDTWGLQHTALAGIDYKFYDLRDSQGFAFGTGLNLLSPMYMGATVPTSRYNSNTTTLNQVGLYGQDQIRFDRLTVVGGVREDLVFNDTRNRVTGVNTDSSPTATTGKVGAIYTLDNGFAPYVSYATSFNPILGTNFFGVPFAPETGEQEEIGVKYQSPVLPFTAGIALFNLTRDNAPVTDQANVFNTLQTGQQRSRGVEVSAQASLLEGLNLIGAFTAYDLTVTRDTTAANVGKTPTNVPQLFGSLWLDYTVPAGEFAGLGAGAGVRYTGQSFADPANTLRVPDYVLGDATVHYERGSWRAALNVSNIADDVYVGSCSTPTACFYGDRRKFTGSLTYKW